MISYQMVGTNDLPRVVSREKVDNLYATALELGGTSEGQPGLRGETFYAAYFRDPDGNKFNFFCQL